MDEARWPARPGEAQFAWEPPRTASCIPNRAARLKCLGNAVVPQVAEAAGVIIAEFDLRRGCKFAAMGP